MPQNSNLSEQFSFLIELQKIDSEGSKLTGELESIPEKRDLVGKEYLDLKRLLDEKEAQLQAVTKERQELEGLFTEAQQWCAEREKRLYSIKTQKEYQASLKEVAEAKKENKEREDRILKLLEEGEVTTKEIEQLKPQAADKEIGFKKMEEELHKRGAAITEILKKMGGERSEVLGKIVAPLLKRYDFVRKRYADAVVHIAGDVCQGCNMNIPPQLYNEILRAKDLKDCPNCHRLIYVLPPDTMSEKMANEGGIG